MTYAAYLRLLLTLLLTAIGGCSTHVHCVAEGTRIATPAGQRPIEELSVGDHVLTKGPAGEMSIGTITAVHAGWAGKLLTMSLEGGPMLRVTPEHLISTPEGWQRADDVAATDLITACDTVKTIVAIEATPGRHRVYDLTVEPGNMYFAESVLVHNKTIPLGLTAEMRNQPLTFNTAEHRYWVELKPRPGRAFRVSHHSNEVERLNVLSWESPGFGRHLEIVMQAHKPRKIEVNATIVGRKATATVREHGKTIAEGVAFRTVEAEEREFELLRQSAAKTAEESGIPYRTGP